MPRRPIEREPRGPGLAAIARACSLRDAMADENDDPERPIESPPEGSMCSEHPERPAVVVCPRCGAYACLSCWHGPVRSCHACLVRRPPPPVPWEDPSRGWLARVFGTLHDAAAPNTSAPAFRSAGTERAALFFALTFVPLAALSGIVPYTVLLLFGPGFSVTVQGTPMTEEIALDVFGAALIGVFIGLAEWAALTIPFISLSRAFANDGHPDAPARVMLYRGWLLPAFFLTETLVPLALPERVSLGGALLTSLLAIIPFLLLLGAMRAVTRMGSGVSAFGAILTVGVPFAIMIVVGLFLARGVRLARPQIARLEEAQRLELEREATRRSRDEASASGAPGTTPSTPTTPGATPGATPEATPEATPGATPGATPSAPGAEAETEPSPSAPTSGPSREPPASEGTSAEATSAPSEAASSAPSSPQTP